MSKILIDEATVKLALEALDPFTTPNWPDYISEDKANAAYTALREALAEQPAKQAPVAEVKAKMTGGNVGIATVIHEIYSPLRESLQPGDKLYSGYRWIGWDFEQVWGERIFGIDMRFENVQDAIAFRKKLDEATTPQAQPAREWVGLTDEDKCTVELDEAEVDPNWIDGYKSGLKDAEAKLREKNT